MTWNYRIVRYRSVGAGYGLHEVYYNDQGEAVTMGAAPASFCADTEEGKEGIIKMLTMALADAQNRGILDEPQHWPGRATQKF